MIGERKASPSDADDIPISRTSLYQPLFPITTQSMQHKITGNASTAKNSTLAVERHCLGGSREKSAKNIEPVLHDERLFTKLWSKAA